MKTLYYHESFEYQDEYDYKSNGTKGIAVGSTKIVCPTCNGTGSHFRRDLDENALIDNIQEDGDDEGMKSYLSGDYDQVCTNCRGNNVVNQIDWDTVPEWARKCIDQWEESARQHNVEVQAERAMGA